MQEKIIKTFQHCFDVYSQVIHKNITNIWVRIWVHPERYESVNIPGTC